MKSIRLLLQRLLVCAALLGGSGIVGAYSIGLAPGANSVSLGGQLSLDVVVAGLEAEGHVLSTYDFSVAFDTGLLELLGAQSGGALGAGSLFLETPGAGTVNVFELASSLVSDADLAALQGDTLTIATLSFLAVGQGAAQLAFSDLFALGGEQLQGQTIDLLALPFTSATASVSITARAVPEPATTLLVAFALLLAAAVVKRRRR